MKLADFEPLTEAEQAVIAGLGTGHVTKLGDGSLPGEDAGEDRRVRASLIRWLALGAPGDKNVRLPEKGLRIAGALVVSDGHVDPVLGEQSTPGLDLEGCRLDRDLLLLGCHFEDTPVLRGATLETLNLQASHLPGLHADRLEARGNVVLDGVHATGEVWLLDAQIGGTLECDDARFENTDGRALNADRLETRGSVFLRGVRAKGSVRLTGARIGSDLVCEGGRFENPGGDALIAQGARVKGVFFWREDSDAEGVLDLTAAEIGHICDDPTCWPKVGDLVLDRCRYDAFIGQGISAAERIKWLDLQDPAQFGDEFWPQPWEHCAKVLREMGHAEDARQVLIAKEERQRRARRRRVVTTPFDIRPSPGVRGFVFVGFGVALSLILLPVFLGHYMILAVRDWLLGVLIAYGHRPFRALWWLATMWVIGAAMFGHAWSNDGFKPNNAFILRSPEWAGCYEDDTRSGEDEDYRWRDKYPSTLACYLDQPEEHGYPAFNAALYSLDTLVPVVDLEMQEYWVPDEKVADWARYYLWVHIAAGWFLALLAVAGFSGLIDTRATRD